MGKCPNFLAISLQHSKVCSENCRVLALRSLCRINTVETHTKRNRTTCNTCRERETNETLQRHLPSCQNAHLNFKLISHRHAWERNEKKKNERKQICKLTAHIHTHTLARTFRQEWDIVCRAIKAAEAERWIRSEKCQCQRKALRKYTVKWARSRPEMIRYAPLLLLLPLMLPLPTCFRSHFCQAQFEMSSGRGSVKYAKETRFRLLFDTLQAKWYGVCYGKQLFNQFIIHEFTAGYRLVWQPSLATQLLILALFLLLRLMAELTQHMPGTACCALRFVAVVVALFSASHQLCFYLYNNFAVAAAAAAGQSSPSGRQAGEETNRRGVKRATHRLMWLDKNGAQYGASDWGGAGVE